MRRLSSLLLNSNKIKARGAEALAAALRGNDSLTQLELGANRVRTRSVPLRSQSTSWCRWPVAPWADVGSAVGRCGHNSPLGAPSLAGESATAAASGAPTPADAAVIVTAANRRRMSCGARHAPSRRCTNERAPQPAQRPDRAAGRSMPQAGVNARACVWAGGRRSRVLGVRRLHWLCARITLCGS